MCKYEKTNEHLTLKLIRNGIRFMNALFVEYLNTTRIHTSTRSSRHVTTHSTRIYYIFQCTRLTRKQMRNYEKITNEIETAFTACVTKEISLH